MIPHLEAPVAVVCHDAGATNHIVAWLRDTDRPRFIPCLDGPALALWQAAWGPTPSIPLAQALAGARSVLTGTGWASDLEHTARRLARQQGIPSIAVIDHWTNYRERFVRAGEEILPDAIWVSDAYAKQLASTTFPTIPVTQLPNLYLEELVRSVQRHRSQAPAHTGDHLLYVLEPIREAWGPLPQPGEFLALDYFAQHLDRISTAATLRIRLRPHPSDPAGKYDAWMARHAHLPVTLDTADTLAESLTWADTVVGCQTYAMVMGLAIGCRVFSSIPPWAPPCVLPHAEIIRLSALTGPHPVSQLTPTLTREP